MGALEDIDQACEQNRQRLYAAMQTLVDWSHADGDCEHNPADCLAADYETTLRQIDRWAVTSGQPWHIGLAHMVTITEHSMQQIEEEGSDE